MISKGDIGVRRDYKIIVDANNKPIRKKKSMVKEIQIQAQSLQEVIANPPIFAAPPLLCTIEEDSKPCNEPILTGQVCYDHATVSPDGINPIDARQTIFAIGAWVKVENRIGQVTAVFERERLPIRVMFECGFESCYSRSGCSLLINRKN